MLASRWRDPDAFRDCCTALNAMFGAVFFFACCVVLCRLVLWCVVVVVIAWIVEKSFVSLRNVCGARFFFAWVGVGFVSLRRV